ncbi:hypothetical protein DOY81_001645 [Sarcophaga bullata]|nr:hypothetical protein DOY81_001645 [Sarcophaga bullata]
MFLSTRKQTNKPANKYTPRHTNFIQYFWLNNQIENISLR